MTIAEVLNVLRNERECVRRADSGCDRDCGRCDLLMDGRTILAAYDTAISILGEQDEEITDGQSA